ncbi:hypothetical protein FRC08_015898 [Ceratobasidium sp. 394]|nr:hypothetical protein FRC08_015898 [Ceratobasidium sp. 394]
MTRGRRASVHELQASARPATPEPTTALGVTPGDALFDTPPPPTRPTTDRTRTTEPQAELEVQRVLWSEKWTRTHGRNLCTDADNVTSVNPANDNAPGSTSAPAPTHANNPPVTPKKVGGTQRNPSKRHKPGPARRPSKARIADPKTQTGRKPSTTRRPISHSPSPGSSDCPIEELPIVTGKTPGIYKPRIYDQLVY